jgi:hypothetical protein
MTELNLTELETEQHHFLTTAAGANFGHAASVCFESRNHGVQIDLTDEGYYKKAYSVNRYPVTDQLKRTWGDEEYTTEQGAYGVAFLIASAEMKVKAIEKSRKKTGIDYWLGMHDGFLFQNTVRLEVSGIRNGTDYQLNERYEDKMTQSERSDGTGLPALIVVVEFNKPRVKTGLRNIL